MKNGLVVVSILGALCLNCGGGDTPPAQDPSSTTIPAAASDAGAPTPPATTPPAETPAK